MTNDATRDRHAAIADLMLSAYQRGNQAALDADTGPCPSPLSGEWAGESLTELLGELADDEEATSEYETAFTEGWNVGVRFRTGLSREGLEASQEAIYRGEPCPHCQAQWDGTALDHHPACAYLRARDLY